MKIAIVIGYLDSAEGGGFTFEEEIFTSICKVAKESPHFFTLISDIKMISKIVLPVNLRFLYWRKSFFTKLFSQFSKSNLGHDFHNFSRGFFSGSFNRILARMNADLVWFASPYYICPVNIPYIATIWDLQHRYQPWFPEISLQGNWENRESLYRRMLLQASFIIAGTKRAKDEIVHYYSIDEERIAILPHPTPSFALDNDDNDSQVQSRYGLPDRFIFYPSQFWPHKNHYTILCALRILNDSNHKIAAVFVGADKGNRNYIEKKAKEFGLSDQIFFLGFVSRAELISLYKCAEAMVYASFLGTENLPPLEAFALGCPAIVAHVHGADEQLGDAALFFTPTDAKQLSQLIIKLREDDELRQKLIERGYVRAQRWRGVDFVRGMLDIFDHFATIRATWEIRR
jgi:glycosyltransferase involved in cell wall biosynthesis